MRSSQGDKPGKSSGGSAQVLKYIWGQFGKIYPQTFSQEPPFYLARKLNDIDYIPECKSHLYINTQKTDLML